MATIFPGSASVNQEFNGYRFNGTTWDIIGQEYNPTVYSANQPVDGKAGDIWIDSSIDVEAISPETILTINSASALYLTKTSASTTYATKTELSNIDLSPYLTSSNASSTYLTKASASTTYATKAELANIDLSSASAAAVAAIVDSAPATLDTLNELAAALGDDANFASTVATSLGNKLDASSASTTYATKASPTFTGTVVIPTLDLTNSLTPQDGGTGLSSLGSAGYVLKVNSGANALEWGAIAGAVYQASAPTSPQNGDIWIDSNASASLLNTNDFLLKNDVPTTAVYKMNSGTTAARPTGAEGMFRFNTTTGYPEWYDSATSAWYNFYQQKVMSIEYLVVGGGSGGSGGTSGTNYGSAGAGGIVLTSTISIDLGIGYTVTVGAGGAGSLTTSSPGASSVFSAITATGGNAVGQSRTGGSNALYSGGTGSGLQGGGGAGAGGNGSGMNGGIAVTSSISGSSVGYGGGGAGEDGGAGGTPGTGGGDNSNNAVANRGGGGGGGSASTSFNGGLGVVILSYPSAYTVTVGAGLTSSTGTVGANKVTTFTAGTGTVSFV
jgi:hypothetical protein